MSSSTTREIELVEALNVDSEDWRPKAADTDWYEVTGKPTSIASIEAKRLTMVEIQTLVHWKLLFREQDRE